jgi:flagellar assembly protein FliH
MSSKTGNLEYKTFKFGSLVPEGKTKDTDKNANGFKFSDLNSAQTVKNDITEEKLRNERIAESKSPFKISDIVRESRGINRQEQKDFEEKLNKQVDEKFKSVRELGYNEGLLIGKREGYEQAYNEALEVFSAKIQEMEGYVQNLKQQTDVVFEKNRQDTYSLIKNLTKWVILKEINDKEYLPRLLEKLVLELNQKANLLIKVNSENFAEMPHVLEEVQKKLGKLTNVRVEIGSELQHQGIILESEHGILDGSLEAQFKNLDRLFETVGLSEHES